MFGRELDMFQQTFECLAKGQTFLKTLLKYYCMLANLFEHAWPLAKCLKVFLNIDGRWG